jgi:D-alanyl-D-alanine carboxypeptidase (penicillin-binding protein 5/6)
MTGSVNDSATAISGILNNRETFVAEMNSTARQAGISELTFRNETGLDVDINNSSATGSAKDVTALIEYALRNYPDIFDATTVSSITVNSTAGISHQIQNTNKITRELNGLIGSKTGFTDLAGGNLAIVIDKGLNEPIAIVVLGSPDSQTRFDDVLAILKEIKK